MQIDSIKAYQLNLQTIFIADDDTDDQLLLSQALRDIAPHVRLETIKDGHELLSLLQSFKPDLLFLDLEMPGRNGLECLKSIRSNEVYTDMPIVVFSSTSRPANIAAAYEMGADLFFVKPASYQQLTDTIRTIFNLNWADPAAIQALKLTNTGSVMVKKEPGS